MFEIDNRIYYDGRAAHATGLGDRATDPKIAALHYELALRYAILSFQGRSAAPQVVAFARVRGNAPSPFAAMNFGCSDKPELEQAQNSHSGF